jgi:hypothetical protein
MILSVIEDRHIPLGSTLSNGVLESSIILDY